MDILGSENSKYSIEKQTILKNVFALCLGYIILYHIIELVSAWRPKKKKKERKERRNLNGKANFGRNTTAGFKEWKTEVKKNEREERNQKTCFSAVYQTKGRLWRSLKTEVKKERVKKWALSSF